MPDSRDARWYLQRMPEQRVLDSVLRGDPVDRLLRIARDRAIANKSVVAVPRGDADDPEVVAALQFAKAAAVKLSGEGETAELTEEEKEALDLFIILVARPAIFVRDNNVVERPENWRDDLDTYAEALPPLIAGVGRIETAARAKSGSGFIVGERRILTNNHVLCSLFGWGDLGRWSKQPQVYADRCADASREWSENPSAAPIFELRGELGSDASSYTRITRILGHHTEVDVAVLELESMPAGAERLPLMNREPEGFKGRRIYAVGYPVDDSRDLFGKRTTPAPVFRRIFGADDASLGTKRFSPGIIIGSLTAQRFDHDASTLPGSSGSCIVDFEHERVLGIHYAGAYKLEYNRAVPLWKFREDAVLKDNGVVFD